MNMFTSTVFVINYSLIAYVYSTSRMCYVMRLPGFEDKRVTDHVMWTEQNMTSRLKCAARCNQHDLAEMCGYNQNTGVCVAYNATFTDPSSVIYYDDSGYRMYSLCPGGPALGTCKTSADCLVANTFCMEGECVCDMMFVFSHAQGGCIQNCSHYGTTFTRYVGYILREHNDIKVESIPEKDCQAACISETSILCKTVDYNPTSNNCFLSSTGWSDAPATSRAADAKYNMHIRHCDV
ncbi:uncharacterized protein LOC124140596 isoform X1 [Haliotis rufescens]|uniref:uncharacterized protein LOC124140596 isoform X1 n=1 Tax=Haliotis rufescens TaxID=6454 RepID=UPI00201ED9D4|nr:uncharacterized protein LOC124140596 isoform X1 [Haliotis rufescens]